MDHCVFLQISTERERFRNSSFKLTLWMQPFVIVLHWGEIPNSNRSLSDVGGNFGGLMAEGEEGSQGWCHTGKKRCLQTKVMECLLVFLLLLLALFKTPGDFAQKKLAEFTMLRQIKIFLLCSGSINVSRKFSGTFCCGGRMKVTGSFCCSGRRKQLSQP